jgi:GMC oxidoreductase
MISNMTFDLCVIGAGPAGIITVLEFAALNPEKKIALIEFGKNDAIKNVLDDSIIVKNDINHHPPYECTNKGLGGSSKSYGGRCVMYDEVDFEVRDILNGGCTWDASFFEDTKRYVPKTAEYFECGAPVFNLNESLEFKDLRIADNFVNKHVVDTVVERWSMPTRFGKRYRETLENLPNVTILEGYQAASFSTPDGDGVVSELKVLFGNEEIMITSKKFVISCGTQETTRLLLKNLHVFANLKQVPDALGKYYQGHISGKIASVKFNGNPKKTEFGFLKDKDGIYIRRRFQFTSQFLKQHDLLNTAIWLDNPLYSDPKHKSGAMSLMYLIMLLPVIGKLLAPPAIAESITKGKRQSIGKHLFNVLKDFPFSFLTTLNIFIKRYLAKRKLPGVFLYNRSNTYALHFHAEQTPHKNNFMELSEDGKNLIINYNLNESDVHSIIRLHEELDTYLREINCGKLEYWYPKEALFDSIKKMSKDGLHQSGTTRIAKNENEGVVDYDLKVFGTKNLYVCSGGVFPTSGQANTTFFLGVLAVRLANHLTKV